MSGYEALLKINAVLWRIFIVGFVVFIVEYLFGIHWVLSTGSLFILAVGSLFAPLFLVEFIWSFFIKQSGG